MITQLRLQNFKSWRDTGLVRFAPMTALFGGNSSGKTSLLQMLLMLKQTVESSDRSLVLNLGDERSSLVELGTYRDLLFEHDVRNGLTWQLEWQLPERLDVADALTRDTLASGDVLGFSAALGWTANGERDLGHVAVERMAYRFGGHEFGVEVKTGRKPGYDLFSTHPHISFKRSVGRVWPLPPPSKCYGFPDQVRAYFQNSDFLSDFELRFEQLFSRLFYLGPLREYPKRQYTWTGAQPSDMGRRGERVVDALLASRVLGPTISPGYKRKRMTLEERVAQWLKDLGLIDSFSVRPITEGGQLFQVWVRKQPKAAEVLITDVGFGVSQILPVIALCYYAPPGTTIILEQPEIHLHPAVQAGLADVFIDAIKHRGVQIILESHSEHLLRRLQRRVAEGGIRPDDAALYFCSTDAGQSRLTELDIDLFGNIKNWPEGFFGDELGEIAAMQKAVMERRRQQRSL